MMFQAATAADFSALTSMQVHYGVDKVTRRDAKEEWVVEDRKRAKQMTVAVQSPLHDLGDL